MINIDSNPLTPTAYIIRPDDQSEKTVEVDGRFVLLMLKEHSLQWVIFVLTLVVLWMRENVT